MENECSSMKDLLNEDDFATDISTLFQSRYSHGSSKGAVRIIKASVASVGPSGLFLRAYLERCGNDHVRPERYFLAELSIPFDREATSRDMLRSSILDLVETAASYPVAEEASSVDTVEATVHVEEEKSETTSISTETEIDYQQYLFHKSLLEARLHMEKKASPKLEATTIPEASKTYKSHVIQKKTVTKISRQYDSDALAQKYAQIEDIGERAYTILKDLGMV
jgi:hypothetical protein